MKQVVVIYGKPNDSSHFNQHYEEVHVPLVRRMPHLRAFQYSKGEVQSSNAEFAPHLVAILTYDTDADLAASLESSEGKAAVADVVNFASGGVTILTVTI
jgi:uncharacterized protein (TIGR02118 family)